MHGRYRPYEYVEFRWISDWRRRIKPSWISIIDWRGSLKPSWISCQTHSSCNTWNVYEGENQERKNYFFWFHVKNNRNHL